MLKTVTLRSTLIALSCALSFTARALADAPPRAVEVPSGDLTTALETLARQSGVELVYQSDQVKGLRSQGVSGTLSAEQAVRKLLEGTPLILRTDSSGAMVIALPKTPAALKTSSTSQAATPEASVAPEERQGFWSRFRLAQADTARDSASTEDDAAAGEPKSHSEDSSAKAGERDKQGIEQVVVTGTLIRAERPISEAVVINRKAIRENAFRSTDDILNSLPQNFAGGVNIASTVGAGNPNSSFNYGFSSAANLRGMGPGSTLTLINGRRVATDFIEGTVDISAIPFPAIKQVDVVLDGSSAIYGADAVAGVVNFILDDDHRGFDTTASYGFTQDGGASQVQVDQLAGIGWNNGGLVLSAQYFDQDSLLTTQRDYLDIGDGFSSLLPTVSRWSGFASLSQDIGEDLSLNGWLLSSRRKVFATASGPGSPILQLNNTVYESRSGSLQSNWTPSERVEVQLSFDYSDNDLASKNDYFTSGVHSEDLDTDSQGFLRAFEGLVRGTLMESEHSRLRAVGGGGHRSERLVTNFNSGFVGARNNTNLFGEILWAIGTSERRDLVDLSASLRWDDYSDFGTSTNFKLGARYFPVPQLSLSTTYGTEFKTPTLYQVYGSRIVGASDAARLGIPGFPGKAALLLDGANPDLTPEEARTFSIAADVDLGRHFSANATYFDVDYSDRIQLPFNNATLVYEDPALSAFVVRSPTADEVLATIAQATQFGDRTTGGNVQPEDVVAIIDRRNVNLAAERIRGVDLSVRSGADLAGMRIEGTIGGSFLNIKRRTLAGSPTNTITGVTFNPPKTRFRSSLSAAMGATRLAIYANYTSASHGVTTNGAPAPATHVDSWFTLDLTGNYAIRSSGAILNNSDITIKITNLLNSRPPLLPETIHSIYNIRFDSTNASALGRFVQLTVHKAF